MHDDRAHTDMLEKHDIRSERRLQRRVGHGVAAVFDDDGLAQQAAAYRAAPPSGPSLCRRAASSAPFRLTASAVQILANSARALGLSA